MNRRMSSMILCGLLLQPSASHSVTQEELRWPWYAFEGGAPSAELWGVIRRTSLPDTAGTHFRVERSGDETHVAHYRVEVHLPRAAAPYEQITYYLEFVSEFRHFLDGQARSYNRLTKVRASIIQLNYQGEPLTGLINKFEVTPDSEGIWQAYRLPDDCLSSRFTSVDSSHKLDWLYQVAGRLTQYPAHPPVPFNLTTKEAAARSASFVSLLVPSILARFGITNYPATIAEKVARQQLVERIGALFSAGEARFGSNSRLSPTQYEQDHRRAGEKRLKMRQWDCSQGAVKPNPPTSLEVE